MKMLQLVIEFVAGSLLVYLSVRSQLNWFFKSIEKYLNAWVKQLLSIVLRCGIGLIGAHLLLNPLVPGQPTIYIHAPPTCPTRPENLRIKLAPICFDGDIDCDRTSYSSFSKGLVTEIVVLHVLEQRLQLTLYDETQKNPIEKQIVYLSPYVRCGLWDKHVYFK